MFSFLLYYLCLFSFVLSSDEIIFSFNDYKIHKHSFFQQIPFSEWEALDSLGKKTFEDSFIAKELSYLESLSAGLDVIPKNYIKLKQRRDQLLINNTYEALVAYPLINKENFLQAKNNIKTQVLAHHILIGYKGCSLSQPFSRTKEEAFSFADSLQKTLILSNKNSEKTISFFSETAKKHSEDPSVSSNGGFIGWISWGRVMEAFQKEAFSLDPFVVSSPVLTPYGYHLILIEDKKPSDYSYYNPSLLDGFSKKMCLQGLSFDSLRIKSQAFDSLLLEEGRFTVNSRSTQKIFSLFEQKKNEGLRGNKSSYIAWVEEKNMKDLLFVFKNKGFGVGWFINSLKKTPATRVPAIKKEEDLLLLLKSFVVQEEALFLGKKEGVDLSAFFQEEYLKHKKNILHNEYVSVLINSVGSIDSSLVEKKYSKGLFVGEFIKPKSVVYSEIRTKTKEEVTRARDLFVSSGDFDFVLDEFGGEIKNPVTLGRGGPLATEAFSLKEGEVSSVVENLNKTFSLIRVEKFIKEEPFSLERVYKQIERQIKKSLQDSIKNNLSANLKRQYKIEGFSIR